MHIVHIDTPTLLWCVEASDTNLIEQSTLQEKMNAICPTAPTLSGRPEMNKVSTVSNHFNFEF